MDEYNLSVFDYVTTTVHLCKVEIEEDVDPGEDEYIVDSLGFDTSNCHWMFGDPITIIEHKEVMKCTGQS